DLDVEPQRADGRVARSGEIGDADTVHRDAGADADRAGFDGLAGARRVRVRVGERLQGESPTRRAHVGAVGEGRLRDGLDDVDRGRAGDGNRVATGPVVVGGLRLPAVRVVRA